jgi:metal-responsive CopG/Arc/MetJ family transcriptional regulator
MLSDKKKIYNIILEKQVKEEIDKIAKNEDRSGSSMINWILKKYIEEYNLDKEK